MRIQIKNQRIREKTLRVLRARDEAIQYLCKIRGFTYDEVGQIFGLTRQRIEQIVNRK